MRAGKTKKFSTVEVVYKSLGSNPLPSGNRVVRDMDLLTSSELNGGIIYESSTSYNVDNVPTSKQASLALGYLLDVIFTSFGSHYHSVDLDSFSIPWNSIPLNIQNQLQQSPYGAYFHLYSTIERRWNWPLFPSKGSPAPTSQSELTPERLLAAFYDAIATAVKQQQKYTDEGEEGKLEDKCREGKGKEKEARSKDEGDDEGICRHWMAEWSQNVLQGSSSSLKRKPDLILVDKATTVLNEVTWLSPMVLGEFTTEQFEPAGRLGKTMDTKAYMTFLEQPWRRFVLGLSIANQELRIHFYDRSGGAVSPPFDIHEQPLRVIYILSALTFGHSQCISFDPTIKIFRPLQVTSRRRKPGFLSTTTPTDYTACKHAPAIGTIQVGTIIYEIIDILYSSPGFVGRGTVCYLVRHDGILYVIKDSWVRRSKFRELLNEISIMRRLDGVDGVPRLHDYCIVQVDGTNDCTERYREPDRRKGMKARRVHLHMVMTPAARPLAMFRSKKELVSSTRDIVRVMQSAAEKGILHRDCSLNNVAIEDVENGPSRGLLLDWEFGVEVNTNNRYSIGGTGTVLFMSSRLLKQIFNTAKNDSLLDPGTPICKAVSVTCEYVEDKSTVEHTHADDIESLFYVFVWIIIRYDGPLGHQRTFEANESTLLDRWSGAHQNGLASASDAKVAFLLSDLGEEEFKAQISPYFRDLFDLVNKWRKVVGKNVTRSSGVEFSDVLPLFDEQLAKMTDEKPPEMAIILSGLENDHTRLTPLIPKRDYPELAVAHPLLPSRKRFSEDVRSMDNPALPSKRFRHM